MISKEDFIKKYGFWEGDKVVHHSYIHGENSNKDIADRILKVVAINLATEHINVTGHSLGESHKTTDYYRAGMFEKLPNFKSGDTVIVHKPIDVKIPPIWVDGMDKRDNEELDIQNVQTFYASLGVGYGFNLAWLEMPKDEPFESEILLDDFL